jgi:dTDP-4-dehydrorhamnose 3,5-epimerase
MDTPPIVGVSVTALRQIPDARGAVLHMLRSDEPDFLQFGECYFSEVLPGAVKGWKRHRVQTQTLVVPVGRIRMVIYDARAESLTHKALLAIELGRPDAYVRLRIPPGVWYGFACVSEVPALLVNCADSPHDPGESDTLALDTHEIPYNWTKQLS